MQLSVVDTVAESVTVTESESESVAETESVGIVHEKRVLYCFVGAN